MSKITESLKYIFGELFGLFYDDTILALGVIVTAVGAWLIARHGDRPLLGSVVLMAGFFLSLLISVIRQLIKKART